MTTKEQPAGKVYNHRDFWVYGAGAKGLDRDALSIHDVIEFDNGDRIPSFACSHYGRNLPMHGPLRPLTDAQMARIGPLAQVFDVRADGTAVVWDKTHVAIGYSPRYREITADGRVVIDR